ncbi:MAG: type II secretion system protein [Clostridia bacterium]|nr:type II secretion system protein [Clostridia bacterium]
MKNQNKKGFTIVELVIVIAVIAILAAVLIPTFVGLVNKANRAADTALAKELNTAIAMSETDVDTFEQAIAALREGGFILANLNAKADGCYFVWDDETNQIIYVDANNKFEILYSNGQASTISEKWILTVSNKSKAEELKDAELTVVTTLASVKDLADALVTGGEVYIDESVVLDYDNTLQSSSDITINLGNANLTTNGTLENRTPIFANANIMTINGGKIGASGTTTATDTGKAISNAAIVGTQATLNINDTVFNSVTGTTIHTAGILNANNITIDIANGRGISIGSHGSATLNDVTINAHSDSSEKSDWYGALWVSNYGDGFGHTVGEGETPSTMIINSGSYTGHSYAVRVYSGEMYINGGAFVANGCDAAKVFWMDQAGAKIVITGGTFNGHTFEQLCDENYDVTWKDLCMDEYTVDINMVNEKTIVTISR